MPRGIKNKVSEAAESLVLASVFVQMPESALAKLQTGHGVLGIVALDSAYVGKNGGVGFRSSATRENPTIADINGVPCYLNVSVAAVGSASKSARQAFEPVRAKVAATATTKPVKDSAPTPTIDLSGWGI